MCLSQIHKIRAFLSLFYYCSVILTPKTDSSERHVQKKRQLNNFVFSQSQLSRRKPENNVPKTAFCKTMLFPMNFPVYLSVRKLNFTQIKDNHFCLASIWEFGKHLQCFKRKFVAFVCLSLFILIFHCFDFDLFFTKFYQVLH